MTLRTRPRPVARGRSSHVLEVRRAGEVRRAVEAVAAAMAEHGYAERDVFALKLGLEEAVVNALKHGHKGDPSKTVRVVYRVGPARVVVRVRDEGPGFDPAAVPDPLAEENLGRDTGRGLLLMRHYLTEVRHNARGNAVTLCLGRRPPARPREA
jgi:serine/threonine-protein kinase RsbW